MQTGGPIQMLLNFMEMMQSADKLTLIHVVKKGYRQPIISKHSGFFSSSLQSAFQITTLL
jgi:hypothetical protein